MAQSVNYQCPACGGRLEYDSDSGLLVCGYCESRFTVEAVEKYYEAQQARRDAAAVAEAERTEARTNGDGAQTPGSSIPPSSLTDEVIEEAVSVSSAQTDPVQAYLSRASWKTEERKGMRSFTCSSCGANLMVDATTAISECPYCGNGTVIAGVLTDDVRPDFLITFKKDRQDALEALNGFYRRKLFLPNAFVENNRIEHVQGVYVPFWLYDARAYGDAKFTGIKKYSRGHSENGAMETTIDFYDAVRSGYMDFKDVPADASDKMPDEYMDSLEPYDLSEMETFSMAHLPGYVADRYDVDAGQSTKRARRRMKESLQNELEKSGEESGYTEISYIDLEMDVEVKSISQIMLPVWMLNTRYEGKDYLFAMNGQTGKIVGKLPVSKQKVVTWFLRFFAISFAICFALGAAGVEEWSSSTLPNLLVDSVLPSAVMSVIFCSIAYGQMKNVQMGKGAGGFVVGEGFHLTGGTDRFRGRTTMKESGNADESQTKRNRKSGSLFGKVEERRRASTFRR